MSDYYVMLALHGTQDTVMYPFDTMEEMKAFKEKVDVLYRYPEGKCEEHR